MPDSTNPWAPTEKFCRNCSRWVSLEDFPLNRRMHLGRGSWCRECHRAANKDWRRRDRERVNAKRRAEYRAAHPRPTRACLVCGRDFSGRPDALVCGEECRRQRKIEQRRALNFVSANG
jgi:predicted nucleic acid-binding Zn ribbon protein